MTAWASDKQENLCRLWELVHSEDRLTSANALWVMTHLTKSDNEWLTGLHDEMIDMLLKVSGA